MVIKIALDQVEKPKSDGAKSGEYGGWRIMVIPASARRVFTAAVTWGRALSWLNFMFLVPDFGLSLFIAAMMGSKLFSI